MKVAIVNQHPDDVLGGSEIQCDIIADELTRLGHEVCYFALGGKKKKSNLSYSVIPTEKHPKIISKEVIRSRPDVVYWRYNKKYFYKIAKYIKRANIPIVFAVSHVNDVKKWRQTRKRSENTTQIRHWLTSLRRLFVARYNHLGFKYVDGIVANNPDHLNVLCHKRQAYIPNSNTTEKTMFRWQRQYIVWVANLKPAKRPEVCIDVAKAIENEEIDVIMVGGIQDKYYDYFLDASQLPKNLHYIGKKKVQQVNGIINNSICLIHTCMPEGFPGNFIQSWLQGKPTVSLAFDPGGLISSNSLGFVSNNDLSTFITDIEKLINDHALREELGKNAQAYALQNHNPETNVRKLEQFIYEIIQ